MPNGKPQHGFTYIALLIAMAVIGATLASAGMVWHTVQQRERESQLLYVGDQIRQAIGRYYNARGFLKEYPQTLDELLRDPRHPGVVRHLRKRYYDPITGSNEWGLVKDENDRITGVFSLSGERPLKQANFSFADREFKEKENYSEWQFVYIPKKQAARVSTSSSPPATKSGAKK